MVEQILSMSMENRERLALRIERTELLPLLEAAAAQARLSAVKPCEIKVEVAPESLSADMDASLISSVIAILLDNALKYSGDRVEICITAQDKDDHTIISVADNGIGIAPDRQTHIFEKFYRVPTGNVHNVESILHPRREADILQRLCQHQGEIVPTRNILLDLWGDDDFFNARSLQVLITRLRIINVRGTSYKLIAE